MKCNYCWKKASWSMKSIFYGNTFYKFICTYHFIEETLSLLEIREKLKENGFNDKCSAYFIEQNSMIVFQTWDFEKMISETLWLKTDKQEWKFYIKTLDQKFNKYFLLEEILKIEKDFILKTFKEKSIL